MFKVGKTPNEIHNKLIPNLQRVSITS